ncbi:hypothetical protein CKO28_16895 [Rhodovibrio sodomensis]|uniref:Ketosynthase n=1 Tax=Rhodovibrio sodomensis TaxID=1088 RepID=A0ABS1DHM8_9PROT|nr:hypothetical protein [Rhodovibrio sodomensis]MBK1669719.1 hypothetical protein [Rhodovibrio sodomensis]
MTATGAGRSDAPARARPRTLIVRALIALAALAAVHLCVLADRSALALACLIWGVAAAMLLNGLAARGRQRVLLAGAGILIAALGTLQAAAPAFDPRLALLLPPTLGNLAVSSVFAYTLLPGHEPAILRVARVSRGQVPADLAAHARRVTWVWAVLPAAIMLAALSALAFGGLGAWSWIANVANPVLLLVTFLGEHLLRGWKFPQYGRPSVIWTLSVMLDKRAWPLPQRGHA